MATAPAQEWATCSTTAAIGLPLRAIATARATSTSTLTKRACTSAIAATATVCVWLRIYKNFAKNAVKHFSEI